MGSLRSFRYSQLGVLLAALVLLGIFALAVRTVRSFQTASDAVLRSQEARLHLAETTSHLKDVNTATRTFLINGDERILPARQQSVVEFTQGMAGLRGLVGNVPEQQQAIDRLNGLVGQLLAEYDVYLELRRSQGQAAVTARAADGEVKRLADELRLAATELQAAEARRLDGLLHGVRQSARTTLAILIGGLVLDVALVISVVLMLRRDFRAREAAAAALRQQSDEIKDLYNRAPCGYHSIDADGRVVAINDTELAWLGYTREEVIGRLALTDLLTPASRPKVEAAFARLKLEGEARDLEVEVRRKDGSTFPALINGSAICDAQGRFVATRAALIDLTDRKRIESRLEELNASLHTRGDELEHVNRELEAFSYSVSHDLRAPLRHIDYFAGALEKHLSPQQLDPKAKRYLATISASARSMGQLIDDLLSFARISRTELRRTRVRLDEIVAETRQGLQTETNGRSIAWQVSALPEVVGDPALLRQVIVNLLSNAVKYTRRRPDAQIEIAAEPAPAGEVVVRVRDNGAGFDMKFADKLFGVFQRLHGANEFEGTGVGLANVRRIVERHGGRIWAEAEVDRGATFRFTLPAPRVAVPTSS
jgi:PAS domain S-box-containing protein